MPNRPNPHQFNGGGGMPGYQPYDPWASQRHLAYTGSPMTWGPGYGGFGEGVPGTGPWGWTNPQVWGPSGAPGYQQPSPSGGPWGTGGYVGPGGEHPGGGDGGGGGGMPDASMPPWAGQIPAGGWWGMPSALPWSDWGDTPWAHAPEGREAEAQTWMNTMLPWYQQQMAWQQFMDQMAWQQERFGHEHGWEQDRFGQEMGWQQERFGQELGWQQEQFAEQMAWAQAQQAWQEQQAALDRELREQMQNVQTFGRRWQPQTRWF